MDFILNPILKKITDYVNIKSLYCEWGMLFVYWIIMYIRIIVYNFMKMSISNMHIASVNPLLYNQVPLYEF